MSTDVVTAFLRSQGEVLLMRRAEGVGSYQGRWAGVSGYAEGEPDVQVREEIAEETGLGEVVSLVRTGRPVTVSDDRDEWRVHPYLFDCADRAVTLCDEHDAHEWVHPTEILHGDRETVPSLWTVYERVAPTVRSIAADADHGASYLSIRALEVLRDRASVLVEEGGDPDAQWGELSELAERLGEVRPSMAVLHNRINRVMAETDRDAASVLESTIDGIERAVSVDESVEAETAGHLSGTVLTLSRSGTVTGALERAPPDRLYVAESRPGEEGVGVAEELAETCPVTLHTDAAAAALLAREEIDRVVIGADTVLADGTVVNKTGTRSIALAAAHEDVPVTVTAASDKVTPRETVTLESGAREAVYDGDASIDVANPTFDRTPPALVDEIVMEDGAQDPSTVAALATELANLADWTDR